MGLGVLPEELEQLHPTGRTETMAGFTFMESRLPEQGESAARKVWWSYEAAAPRSIVTLDDSSEVITRSIRRTLDEALLLDPRQRFGAYTVTDVADFREKRHEAGHAHR